MEKPSQIFNPEFTITSVPIKEDPPPKESWFESCQRNKPQSNSVGAAALLFLGAGYFFNSSELTLFWCVGGILGAIFFTLLSKKYSGKQIYISCCVIDIISGLLWLTESDGLMQIAALLNGLAVGLIYIQYCMLLGEISVKEHRGMLAGSIVAACFSIGIYIGMSLKEYVLQGFLKIFYGLFALLLIAYAFVESPVSYLEKNNEINAINALKRLKDPPANDFEVSTQLLEHKLYIAENSDISLKESIKRGLPAFVKISLYRAVVICSYFTYRIERDSFYWEGSLRFVAIFITSFIIDTYGRRKPMLIGCVVMAILSFVLFAFDLSDLPFIVFQIFAGVFETSSAVYITEAFPLHAKFCLISATTIFQLIFVIILLSCCRSYFVFLVLGVLSSCFFFFSFYCLPETKQLSLRDALVKFRHWRNSA